MVLAPQCVALEPNAAKLATKSRCVSGINKVVPYGVIWRLAPAATFVGTGDASTPTTVTPTTKATKTMAVAPTSANPTPFNVWGALTRPARKVQMDVIDGVKLWLVRAVRPARTVAVSPHQDLAKTSATWVTNDASATNTRSVKK